MCESGPLVRSSYHADEQSARYRTGVEAEVRDWNTFRALFRPEARLNALGKDREGNPRFNTMAIEDYIRNTGPNFEQNGFFEREIGRVSEQYGDMIHVFSTYESRREEKGIS